MQVLRAVGFLLLALIGGTGAFADGAPSSPASRLDQVLLPAAAVGGWDVVREAPGDPRSDPDLVRWGVRAQQARHYTRYAGPRVQVCSVEVWAFDSDQRARAAEANFAYPDWRIVREGALLLMLRGFTQTRGEPPRRGVFAECELLGRRVRTRAARLVGR